MADSYRVLVTASRTWNDRAALYEALDGAEGRAYDLGYRRIIVPHGGAKGGDLMADDWTRLPSPLPGMTREAEPHALSHADWYPGGRFDRTAGMRRNGEMVEAGAHEALGFADECRKATCKRRRPHDSHGAADCMARAEAARVPVRRITAT